MPIPAAHIDAVEDLLEILDGPEQPEVLHAPMQRDDVIPVAGELVGGPAFEALVRQLPLAGLPELVAECNFAEWTSERILRQASFVSLRRDKPA